MPISHNWQWWMVGLDIHGPLQKGSRCPFILGLQLRDTDPPDLNDPHLLPQKQGLGHFGYRLAKAWLGHQEAWIIVGSANHMGLTAFMEESWHLMVIEVMKMEIYKYICCWSRVTAVLGTAGPEHKTPNSKLLKLCYGNLVNLTMNIDGEITGFSNSSLFFSLFGVFI